MNIEKSNVVSIIKSAFGKALDRMDKANSTSEKKLCFWFAWELAKLVNNEDLVIDFEVLCFKELKSTSRFLDLLFYTHENFKVAIEFKFPSKSESGNSDQKTTRGKVYRDLARLNYLVKNKVNSIQTGAFLCVINERAYVNLSTTTSIYKVHHDFEYDPKISTDISSSKIDELNMPENKFKFSWNGIKQTKPKKYDIEGKIAHLEPIIFNS